MANISFEKRGKVWTVQMILILISLFCVFEEKYLVVPVFLVAIAAIEVFCVLRYKNFNN